MKADIEFPKVEKVGICAIPEENEGQAVWKVHILNMLDEPITNVLVSTRGYGMKEEEQVKTSELRHYFEEVPAGGERPIELIPDNLTGLNNQYWVSFYIDSTIYDKKFIFLPDSLLDKNLTHIPVIDKQGILII
ncbi:MAG: hypothetical protein R2813_05565 [Flavobacteriales bacterium]